MKKILTFAAIAAISLPLMMSCKSKNDPTDPNSYANLTPEERLDSWVSPTEEAAVPITIDNVIGYWKLAYSATVLPGETDPRYEYDYEHFNIYHISNSTYYSFDRSMKFTRYEVDTVNTYEYNPLTSTIEEEKLYRIPSMAEYENDWALINGDMLKQGEVDPMKISVMEKDRMVLTNEDGDGKSYYVYKRIQSLPAFPRTMTDRLIQNAWRVTVDSMITFKQETGEIISTKANRLPANTILKFIEDNDGDGWGEVIIAEGTMADVKARYQCSVYSDTRTAYLGFNFPDDMPYAIPKSGFQFYPSYKEGKALLFYEEIFDSPCVRYKYYIEAVY